MSENEEPEDNELEEKFVHELREEAARKGIDPGLFTTEAVRTERVGKSIHVKWRGFEVNVPAPSLEALDAWFDKYGGVIVGAVIALASVAVGRSMQGGTPVPPPKI